MKKISFIFVLVMTVFTGYSQNFSFGPKLGLSSSKFDLKEGDFTSGDPEIGYHVGVFGRIGAAGFYVQPEVLFTQTKSTFLSDLPNQLSLSARDLNFPDAIGASIPPTAGELTATFNRLDVPVMLGMRMLKIFRIQAGPVASFNLNSSLKNLEGVDQDCDFAKATLGYQAGVGLDLGNLIIDAKYESSFGNTIDNIGGLSTDQRLSQLILSVGFKLF